MTVAPFILPRPEMPLLAPAREDLARVLEALVRLSEEAQRASVLARLEADRLREEAAYLRGVVLARLDALTPPPPPPPPLGGRRGPLQRPETPLGPLGRRVLAALGPEAEPLRAVAARVGARGDAVSQALAALHRRGLVVSPRFGHWCRRAEEAR